MIVIDKETQEDVAKWYALKTSTVNNLIRKVRKDKNHMHLLIDKESQDLIDR